MQFNRVRMLGFATISSTFGIKEATLFAKPNLLPVIKIVPSKKILFRKEHKDITLRSICLRHGKFYYEKNIKYRHLFTVGGIYNWYYLNNEPIKCWKKDDHYVIQDGHRRFIEGNMQGYEDFAVEYVGELPSCFKPTKQLNFIVDNGYTIDFENDVLKINSTKVQIK